MQNNLDRLTEQLSMTFQLCNLEVYTEVMHPCFHHSFQQRKKRSRRSRVLNFSEQWEVQLSLMGLRKQQIEPLLAAAIRFAGRKHSPSER